MLEPATEILSSTAWTCSTRISDYEASMEDVSLSIEASLSPNVKAVNAYVCAFLIIGYGSEVLIFRAYFQLHFVTPFEGLARCHNRCGGGVTWVEDRRAEMCMRLNAPPALLTTATLWTCIKRGRHGLFEWCDEMNHT